jgi:Family of unknown function (DUF5683)
MKRFAFFFLSMSLMICTISFGQSKDSSAVMRMIHVDSVKVKKVAVDTAGKKKHSPRKATLYSAVLPGLGQVYNHSYWKVPVVYAALGITGAVFNYNRKEYNKIKFAYFALINKDTAKYSQVSPELKKFVDAGDTYSLQKYRNEFRKNIDYSVLFFIFFWGLNVVDATVDGHLKEFDISNNLSLKIKPTLNTLPASAGVSFVFTIGKNNAHKSTRMVY